MSGIQRILNKDRLEEIGRYIGQDTAIFPNSLVVNLPPDAKYDEARHTLEIPNRPDSVFVIDGQHRLWAFSPEYSTDTFDLPVSGFLNLPIEDAAEIFATVNRTQRKINPSLVYDLFPLMRSKNAFEFEDRRAQSLVEALYSEERSPWHNKISMLGEREQLITQASFVLNIKRLFKGQNAFTWTDLSEEQIQKELLFGYFDRTKKILHEAWLNPNYVLCKNTGVGASMLLLNRILQKLRHGGTELTNERGLSLNFEVFDEPLSRIDYTEFERRKVGVEYLGEAGIRRFAERLIQIAGLSSD